MSAPDEISGRDPSKSWVAGLIGWSVANQLIVLVLVAALAVSGAGPDRHAGHHPY